MPRIGSQEIEVQDGGMWAFFPTEFRHSTTVVRGSTPRGSLSFGFLVRLADLWQRRFRVAPGIESHPPSAARGRFDEDTGPGQRPSASASASQSPIQRFIATRKGDFSVQEVAEALELEPSDVWEVLRDWQALRLVQSVSSTSAVGGRVFLFREILDCVSEL
jgi:hypothetical protein